MLIELSSCGQNRTPKIILFDVLMKDVRAGENQYETTVLMKLC